MLRISCTSVSSNPPLFVVYLCAVFNVGPTMILISSEYMVQTTQRNCQGILINLVLFQQMSELQYSVPVSNALA